jgi:hypothetical protein
LIVEKGDGFKKGQPRGFSQINCEPNKAVCKEITGSRAALLSETGETSGSKWAWLRRNVLPVCRHGSLSLLLLN